MTSAKLVLNELGRVISSSRS